MPVCPNCGNHIPAGAHGVCYNCVRIEKEYRRYGRRRPKPKRTPRPPGSQSATTPDVVKCHICGARIPLDLLASHKREVHSLEPRTKRSQKRPQEPPRQEAGAEPDSKRRETCPECGYPVPANQLPAHLEHHNIETQRLRRADPVARKRQRAGFNRLLQAVYGEPRLISEILLDNGLSDQDIGRIRARHIAAYYENLTLGCRRWWREILSKDQRLVLSLRYSLKGEVAPTMEMIAGEYGMSISAVRELEVAALDCLRTEPGRQRLEQIVVAAAHTILNNTT